ncbi:MULTISPECIES: hypothetical protein [unclassified Brenneria]|uniref:hypothetical protein n=1 Tax=unclassified Brenneria TaxID=2634434 RepID=UPI0029C40F26|nr:MULTISPECIES: hypothetical protein [unclassified Brenneria]MDX5630811.1 hypothetical protein [Brenneria sp. L3-3Z]MDX5697893.1 hypothetical protein [Brenneria sp. L4-2C]
MNLKECSEKICDLLLRSSYQDEANEIGFLANKILNLDKGDSERISIIESLISRCHPKWLGDYYINGVNYKEWTDLVTAFRNKLKKEI